MLKVIFELKQMNPQQNQNTQSNSAPEPELSFAPKTVFSHTPPSPEQIRQQEELEEKSIKKKKLLKKLAIIIPSALLVVGVLITLLLTGVIPLQKFKTITYTNNNNQQFKLKFYSHYRVDALQVAASSSDIEESKPTFVIANKGVGNKSPLAINLFKVGSVNDASAKSSYDHNKALCGTTLPVALTVRNNYVNDDIVACEFNSQDINFMDMVFFSDSNNLYSGIITQDVDFQTGLSNKENAQKLLGNAGLDAYQDDLKTILSSIQPL